MLAESASVPSGGFPAHAAGSVTLHDADSGEEACVELLGPKACDRGTLRSDPR